MGIIGWFGLIAHVIIFFLSRYMLKKNLKKLQKEFATLEIDNLQKHGKIEYYKRELRKRK